MSDTELLPEPKREARAGSPAGGVYRGRAPPPLDRGAEDADRRREL